MSPTGSLADRPCPSKATVIALLACPTCLSPVYYYQVHNRSCGATIQIGATHKLDLSSAPVFPAPHVCLACLSPAACSLVPIGTVQIMIGYHPDWCPPQCCPEPNASLSCTLCALGMPQRSLLPTGAGRIKLGHHPDWCPTQGCPEPNASLLCSAQHVCADLPVHPTLPNAGTSASL